MKGIAGSKTDQTSFEKNKIIFTLFILTKSGWSPSDDSQHKHTKTTAIQTKIIKRERERERERKYYLIMCPNKYCNV